MASTQIPLVREHTNPGAKPIMDNIKFWVGLLVGIVLWGFSKVPERRAVRRFLPQFLRPRPDPRQELPPSLCLS
jgi:hypothetical protein